jgi:hypothetical protein
MTEKSNLIYVVTNKHGVVLAAFKYKKKAEDMADRVAGLATAIPLE